KVILVRFVLMVSAHTTSVNGAQQNKLDQNHMLSVFQSLQDALAGSELTDDEEDTATSGPDEGSRA
ncbi:hypothetical protein M9458_008665, partial [Cirrhinus mrigala]